MSNLTLEEVKKEYKLKIAETEKMILQLLTQKSITATELLKGKIESDAIVSTAMMNLMYEKIVVMSPAGSFYINKRPN